MRTGSDEFDAPIWSAEDSATPSWPTSLVWPAAWTAGADEQPHDEPDCVCVAVWVTGAVFVASAVEVASFDWVTLPSFPQLPMRIESAEFDGWICVADEAAIAPWSTSLFWIPDWTAEPVPLHPHGEPLCVCVAVWLTGAVFVAFAVESAVFDCDTDPPFPGLSTRTETFELLG
jgi:hypothetical protein